jgi:hypothetical protein
VEIGWAVRLFKNGFCKFLKFIYGEYIACMGIVALCGRGGW